MAQSLEKLIASVLRNYDQNKLALLRETCRKDEKNVSELVDNVLKSIKSDNLQIRYNCVSLAEEFFKRSHQFRQRLIEHLHNFLLYTVETDPIHYPIVGAQNEVKKLKNRSLKIIHEWHRVYGEFYEKLNFAMEYLKSCKTIDLERLRAETVVEKQRESLKIEKEFARRRSITEKIRSELNENSAELKICLTELENGLDLLFPKIDDQEQNPSTSGDLIAHGIFKKCENFNLQIELKNQLDIEESADNSDLIKILKDSYKILKKRYSPKIAEWLKVISKIGSTDDDLVKTLIDYRQRCFRLVEKFEELKFIKETEINSDDDDFVEVSDLIENPETPTENRDTLTEKDETRSLLSETKSVAPTLIFGVDFFDDDQPSTSGTTKSDSDCHRFWRASVEPDESLLRKSASELNHRVVTFCGTFQPVKRFCGALLPDGTVCKRMDREKCPFHGLIGTNAAESRSRSVQKKSWKDSAFRDVQLIKEIESATGVDLRDPKKKKDISQSKSSTARDRLMKKMSNRSSIKRVSSKH